MAKSHECHLTATAGVCTRKFPYVVVWYKPFQRQLLTCYWTLIETNPITEEHKIDPETQNTYNVLAVISEKHSNEEVSVQKNSIM